MEIKVVYAILAELAALEAQLASARSARDRHLRRDDHLGALARELSADAGDAGRAVAEAGEALRRLERELRDVEQAAVERRARVAQVADERQAVAVRAELQALEHRRDALEAEALGLLGALETAEAAAGEARQDAALQQARSRAELQKLSEAADRGAAALAAGEQELERLLGMLPGDLSRHLRRLYGRGLPGVAEIRDGACGGCFGQLPTSLAGEVAGRRSIVRCSGCGCVVI